MRLRFRIAVLVLLGAAAIPAAAQRDSHLSDDPAAPVYQRSAFAHGYIHGYERGYHYGDLDLHMGRNPREPEKIKDYKSYKAQYRNEFGNRGLFENGYQQGFHVGYIDAFAGREFRAVAQVRSLVGDVDQLGPPHLDGNFDQAFSKGYGKGRTEGLNDGRRAASYLPQTNICDAPQAVRDDPRNPFCRAFKMGYELGYSDGYYNQRNPEHDMKMAGDR